MADASSSSSSSSTPPILRHEVVGAYPETLKELFSKEQGLSDYVVEECKKLGLEHESTSKEMEKLKTEPELIVDFHEELKFSFKPSMTTSKLAYKNLVNGLAHESVSITEYCSDMQQYQGLQHRQSNPLQNFDYSLLMEDWMPKLDT